MQTALAPVFMLSGIGALLNVFASRLARVGDQADQLAREPCDPARAARLRRLRRRSRALDFAVVAAAVAAAMTCGSVFVLFLAALRDRAAAELLFALFGGAVVLTMLAILFFVGEMLLAARGLRRAVDETISTISDAVVRPGQLAQSEGSLTVSGG
ncbi:DUF2721 domain-containing protein [Sphingomonas sp. S2-65]|uniref:DUF2721 domain-containing protein n=1 Tax=Sphingomonas sp. S2-65 TaxID=2903960 RepID=UPI0021BC8586|nr:DUF2721 domain-containing protein [Sphingomonas sp. S2-65]UYY58089.1 DUF2721 domain-containing protein [Sphingomonas sp. S2-65]